MGAKLALVVANTEYSDPNLSQLAAPGKDAEAFARVLKEKDLCAFDNITVLMNQPEPVVREAIDEFFAEKKPDDLLVFYFSGHGIRDELGALYLAVKNTNSSRLRSTAIKSDYIRESMDQSRSKRQVLILDCCNSGAFAQGTKAVTGGSVGTATAFEGTGYGRVVLTASDSTQFAWEGDKVIGDTQNSLFTHFLVKGLEGEADLDGDGIITIDELYEYAFGQIVAATPKQTPGKWSYKQQGDIALRQIVRMNDIRPMPLPADLVAALESSLPFVREGAVRQLENILKGRNLGLARTAREALSKIVTEDDSRLVARAAEVALGMTSPAESASAQEINLQEKVEKRPADEVRLPAQIVVEPQAVQTSAPAKIEAEKVENLVAEQSIQTLVEKIVKPDPSQAPRRGFLSQKLLIFVGLAVIAFLIVAGVWAVGPFQKMQSANATSTTFWIAQNATSTEKVNGTATTAAAYKATSAASKATAAVLEVINTVRAVQAKSTDSAKANATSKAQVIAIATENAYFTSSANVSDFFDNNSNKWWTGSIDNDYYIGESTIANGVYQWKVTKDKKFFVDRLDYQGITSNNFDVRVDARRISGTTGKSDYGIVFRLGDNAYYAFQVGDDGFYAVFYYYNNGNNKTTLVDWTEDPAIKKNDWNTLRVSAVGKIFDFYINGVHVNRITNELLSYGKFGLFIEFNVNETGEVYFDNFYIIKH